MKRPQYVFRPNLNEPQHRRAWELLQQMPSANIDTNKNHFFLPPAFYFTVLLRATPLCYVTSFYINRLAVSN